MIGGERFDLVPDDPDLRLRPSDPSDAPFLRRLFGEIRRKDFFALGLSGPIREQVLEQQFRSQAAAYAAQYPDAISLVVTLHETAVGRLLLDCDGKCDGKSWHIVDIALLPCACGRGIGTRIMAALEAGARQRHVIALTLSVLATNVSGRRFYLRQGFAEVAQAGAAHIAMRKDLS